MCLYCMIADWGRQWIPGPLPNPYQPVIWPYPQPSPYTPETSVPMPIWPKEMLDQFENLLKKVKELEDQLGVCPCEEPQKLDYLKEIRKMIEGSSNTASAAPETFIVTSPNYTGSNAWSGIVPVQNTVSSTPSLFGDQTSQK